LKQANNNTPEKESLTVEDSLPLLDMENISVRYAESDVLRNISLHVHRSEILGIIGESGCGKSTLLASIHGMLGNQGKIVNGRIKFQGMDITALPPDKMQTLRGTRIGAIFQNPGGALNPVRKIGAHFYDTMRVRQKISRREVTNATKDLLNKLNLPDLERVMDSYPGELSGGMGQRVVIALAMILKPDLLLADEPTSALDVTIQFQVIQEMMRFREQNHTGIIIVTHNMGVVSKIADKIAVMYAGRVVEYGKKNHIMQYPAHPYTKMLIALIPTLNGRIAEYMPSKCLPLSEQGEGCSFIGCCQHPNSKCAKHLLQPIMIEDEHWSLCVESGCGEGKYR
jgi:peptide/nickel transport system ATP-binding protein